MKRVYSRTVSAAMLILLAACFAFPITATATKYYVAASGDNDGGLSWAKAYNTIDSALAASTPTEIWIKAGTYSPGTPIASDTYTLVSGVTLYGGFAGTETLLSERNWDLNKTILDGQDTVNHILTANGNNVIDGLTIQNGYGADGLTQDESGAGIYSYAADNYITALNCTFASNSVGSRGAAIFFYLNSEATPATTNVIVSNCVFTANRTRGDHTDTAVGGAIFFYSGRTITITDSIFNTNTTALTSDDNGKGGAVYIRGNARISGSTFRNNIGEHGGAVYIMQHDTTQLDAVDIINCNFYNNRSLTTSGDGGALYIDHETDSGSVISGCKFYGNKCVSNGGRGGALWLATYHGMMTDCIFSGNSTIQDFGGAVYLDEADIPFSECIFAGNYASEGGGAFYIPDQTSADPLDFINCLFVGNSGGKKHGGAMQFNSLATDLTRWFNCTIAYNQTGDASGDVGGGIYFEDGYAYFTNCIIYSNSCSEVSGGDQIYLHSNVDGAYFGYNCVDGDVDGTGHPVDVYDLGGVVNDVVGNISDTPQFIGGTRGDWESVDGYDTTNATTTLTDSDTTWTADELIGKFINVDTANEVLIFYITDNTANTITIAGDGTAATDDELYKLYDFNIESGSPCTETGTDVGAPATDIVGTARPQGDEYDMGAYEAEVAAAPPIIYVDYAMTAGADNGITWANAFTNLHDALNAVTTQQIWVAKGTYYPTNDTTKSATFQLVADIIMYGGFTNGMTSVDDRLPDTHKTVLSGDIGSEGDLSDNVYHVVTGADGATLDGFVVYGGYANSGTSDDARGGGLFLDGSYMNIYNCRFMTNYAYVCGGGMYLTHANDTSEDSCVISNTYFENNVADYNSTSWGGGAIFQWNKTRLRVFDSTFNYNIANNTSRGGAIYSHSGFPILSGNTFYRNNSGGHGGAVMMLGPNSSQKTRTISNCTFYANSSAADGGALYLGADTAGTPVNDMILDCDFYANYVDTGDNHDGGAVALSSLGPNSLLANCKIVGNRTMSASLGKGGGLYIYNSKVVVSNTVVAGNHTPPSSYAGGITFHSTASSYKSRLVNSLVVGNTGFMGGGINLGISGASGYVDMMNCTIASNYSSRADAYGGGGIQGWAGAASLTNCIVWGNVDAKSTPQIYASSVDMEFGYNDIGPGVAGSDTNDNGGGINSDPLFDVIPGTQSVDVTYTDLTGKSTLTHTGAFTPDEHVGKFLNPYPSSNLLYYITANSANTLTVMGIATAGKEDGAYEIVDFRPDGTADTIDAGTDDGAPSDDLVGASRPGGSSTDMGCYEIIFVPITDYYVDDTASGDNDGSSWENAFTSMEDATSTVGTNTTIHVAAGTYTCDAQDDSFEIKRSQTWYGGYPDGGGPRDPDNNETILRGGATAFTSGNAYHVVEYITPTAGVYADEPMKIDGFTIRHGYADGAGDDVNGGGIFVDGDHATDRRATLLVTNCIVELNYCSTGDGGGIGPGTQTTLTIRDSIIRDNQAGEEADGAGIGFTGDLYLYDTIISSNVAESGVGTVDGAGLHYVPGASGVCDVQRCTFDYNNGRNGGSIYLINEATYTFMDLKIMNSSASGNGGGVYITSAESCDIDWINCLIVSNSTSGDGGGVYWTTGTSPDSTFMNCTIATNYAGSEGGGIYVADEIDLTNCILWANYDVDALGDNIDGSGARVLVNCDVEGADATSSINPAAGTYTDCIDYDPLFTDPDSQDFKITGWSPCIDAGLTLGAPDHDIDQVSRPVDSAIDIGCYEVSGTAEFDTDGDGIPDYWEDRFSGILNKNDAGDAADDNDSDGVSNLREYIAATRPNDGNDYMRIMSLEPVNSADVMFTVWLGSNRTYTIEYADDYTSTTWTPLTELTTSGAGPITNTYTNVSVASATDQRFYRISVTNVEQTLTNAYTNVYTYATYNQERNEDTFYLCGVPVELGAQNTLDSTLGDIIASGLYGDTGEATADQLWHLTSASPTHDKYFLDENNDWCSVDTGNPTTLELNPGDGFWILRRNNNPGTTYTRLTGPVVTNDVTVNIVSNANNNGWNVISWPYATPISHVDLDASTATDQFGFVGDGANGGTTVQFGLANADEIWAWEGNSWWRQMWLIDGFGASWDDRWWDETDHDFADFTMQAGQAVFYLHRGSGFAWSISEP